MEKKSIVNFKLVTKANGSCELFRGRKRLVSHTGPRAEQKCIKAAELETIVIGLDRARNRKK